MNRARPIIRTAVLPARAAGPRRAIRAAAARAIQGPTPSGAAPARDDLLAQVVALLPPDGPDHSDRVALDVVVKGVRCVFMRPQASSGAASKYAALSPREREIARMIAKGLPNKTIAAVLDISPWTVGTHVRRLFMKLQVTSRAAMVARLLEAAGTEVWANEPAAGPHAS